MHYCILLPGIEYDPADVSWVEDFVVDIAPLTDMRFVPRTYGYLPKWKVWGWPPYRHLVVEEQVYYLQHMRARLQPEDKLSILCHSFGGTIIEHALKEGVRFQNVVMFMPAMDEDFNWMDVESNFSHITVYWSPIDEALSCAYWGKMGWVAPNVQHPRVVDIERQWSHNQWMDSFDPEDFGRAFTRELLPPLVKDVIGQLERI